MDRRTRRRDEDRIGNSLPERLTFWSSLVVVLTLLGFLGYHGVVAESPGDRGWSPMADARVLPEHATQNGARWAIPVQLRNTGNVPLENVAVKVTLRGADGRSEEADLSFSYIAEGGREDAFVVSEAGPAEARPEAKVVSFQTRRDARGY